MEGNSNEPDYVKKKITVRVAPVIHRQMLSVMDDLGIRNESVLIHIAVKAYLNTHYIDPNKK